jgi:hypothetical protein
MEFRLARPRAILSRTLSMCSGRTSLTSNLPSAGSR